MVRTRYQGLGKEVGGGSDRRTALGAYPRQDLKQARPWQLRGGSSRWGEVQKPKPTLWPAVRSGPGALHWTRRWKLAFSRGRTGASVPSGRWQPGLEACVPEEEQVGGTGEALPKLQQLRGGKAGI